MAATNDLVYIEYRVQYKGLSGNGITYGRTFDQIQRAMALFKITGQYIMEGFNGLAWIQIEKTRDYDIN